MVLSKTTMSIVIDADTFLQTGRLPIIDVRSPGEFARGHIPNANNVPLLSDAQRAEIGTLYKHAGIEPAIARGREIVLQKTGPLIDSVRAIASEPDVLVHCWRGGMRSSGFAGLLQQHGFQPRLLKYGYKAYRQAAHRCFETSRRIIILSGHTGSGKTQLLNGLRSAGQQVVDLEGLACHRGSVFGGIDQPIQPTVEQFENYLFQQWKDLDPVKPVWIEGESLAIGQVIIPLPVWKQMSAAPAVVLQVERTQRIDFLVDEYGGLPAEKLAAAIEKIKKRLGGARLRDALDALHRNDLRTFAGIALDYYDKAYTKSLQKDQHPVLVKLHLHSPGQADAIGQLCQMGKELTQA